MSTINRSDAAYSFVMRYGIAGHVLKLILCMLIIEVTRHVVHRSTEFTVILHSAIHLGTTPYQPGPTKCLSIDLPIPTISDMHIMCSYK